MWKCYIITLCSNATQRNERQDNEGDDLDLDEQLVYTYFWSCTAQYGISENVGRHFTTRELGAF